jgi:hypothetical protein
MAYERNPDGPYRSPDDPYRSSPAADDIRRQARLDNELPMDPELAGGRANGGRITMFTIAIAVVLGAVFYGLNNSTINHAGTSSTAQNTTQSSPPAAPPGMRDVTPHANTDQGVTTGAATSPREMIRSGNPPASK